MGLIGGALTALLFDWNATHVFNPLLRGAKILAWRQEAAEPPGVARKPLRGLKRPPHNCCVEHCCMWGLAQFTEEIRRLPAAGKTLRKSFVALLRRRQPSK